MVRRKNDYPYNGTKAEKAQWQREWRERLRASLNKSKKPVSPPMREPFDVKGFTREDLNRLMNAMNVEVPIAEIQALIERLQDVAALKRMLDANLADIKARIHKLGID